MRNRCPYHPGFRNGNAQNAGMILSIHSNTVFFRFFDFPSGEPDPRLEDGTRNVFWEFRPPFRLFVTLKTKFKFLLGLATGSQIIRFKS